MICVWIVVDCVPLVSIMKLSHPFEEIVGKRWWVKVWCPSGEVSGRGKVEPSWYVYLFRFFDNDPFDDHFLRNPFGNIFGSCNIFESKEIFDKQCDVIEDYVIDDHELKSIPYESLSLNPIDSIVIGSAPKISMKVEDTTIDVVWRLLMFEDECILVAPHLSPWLATTKTHEPQYTCPLDHYQGATWHHPICRRMRWPSQTSI